MAPRSLSWARSPVLTFDRSAESGRPGAAISSVVNTVLLKPPPYPSPCIFENMIDEMHHQRRIISMDVMSDMTGSDEQPVG